MPAFNELTTKKDRVAFIREKLGTNPQWATKGLLKVYDAQTADEQAIGATVVYNNVGFSAAHSEIASSFAEQLLKGKLLSPKQMKVVFKIIPKYARQLENVAY